MPVSHRWYPTNLSDGGLFTTRLAVPDGAQGCPMLAIQLSHGNRAVPAGGSPFDRVHRTQRWLRIKALSYATTGANSCRRRSLVRERTARRERVRMVLAAHPSNSGTSLRSVPAAM